MAVTKQDLADFARFADEKLSNGGAESLIVLAREWERQRSNEASVVALQESHQDAEAGRLHPADEVLEEVRKSLDAGR